MSLSTFASDGCGLGRVVSAATASLLENARIWLAVMATDMIAFTVNTSPMGGGEDRGANLLPLHSARVDT